MSSEITKAMKQICEDKDLSYEVVLEALESALAAAFRKDYGNKLQNIQVKFDPETGAMDVWDVKTVVDDLDVEASEAKFQEWLALKDAADAAKAADANAEDFIEEEPVRLNPKTEMMLKDATAIKSDAQVGEELRQKLEVPGEFGRMAAQTAKQVIMQKLREAERAGLYDDFKAKEGAVMTGIVQRRDARGILVDFGKIAGFIPPQEQIQGERYIPGAKIKVLVKSVELGLRGPEIILSRSTPEMVRSVFEKEIPEISNGIVKIMGIVREGGFRSKIAVASEDSDVDPIGACIGQRGGRIQTIIAELGGEKIDVIQFDANMEKFIQHALAPAKILNVDIDEEKKEATVRVAEDQFSLAIGRGGQNVRLASQLAGYKINVVQEGGSQQESDSQEEAGTETVSDGPGIAQDINEDSSSSISNEVDASGSGEV